MQCPSCSEVITEVDKFCMTCGFDLTRPPPELRAKDTLRKEPFQLSEKIYVVLTGISMIFYALFEPLISTYPILISAAIFGVIKTKKNYNYSTYSNEFRSYGYVLLLIFNIIAFSKVYEPPVDDLERILMIIFVPISLGLFTVFIIGASLLFYSGGYLVSYVVVKYILPMRKQPEMTFT